MKAQAFDALSRMSSFRPMKDGRHPRVVLHAFIRLASPPARQPLTDDEIVDAVQDADLDWHAGWSLDDDALNRYVTLLRKGANFWRDQHVTAATVLQTGPRGALFLVARGADCRRFWVKKNCSDLLTDTPIECIIHSCAASRRSTEEQQT